MQLHELVGLIVIFLIFGELTFLLTKLPRTSLKAKDRAILVDTSVLMDGRIIGIAATGFIGGTLVIPRSVVGELQFLADNADAEKRARARHGLDIVRQLQDMETVTVEILQDGSKASEGVDERLLKLARQHQAVICTLDYNLNKVAAVEGTTVLNINELAQSLRMMHLPGDQMTIELVQKGQDSHQAVGYLPDGTMVVVEQAHNYIGKKVLVEVVRSLQTAAGKMMFARRVDQKPLESVKHSLADKKAAQHAKQSGRAPRPAAAVQTAETKPPKPASRPKPTQSASKRQPATRDNKPRSRRRVDREAELIKLVDSQ